MKKIHKSGFVEVECKKCGSKQHMFNRPATAVVCNSCGEPLIKPSGSNPIANENAKIIKPAKEEKKIEGQ